MTKKYLDQLTFKIIGAAIKVHQSLGPGLLESVYQKCLAYELKQQQIKFTTSEFIPINYGEIEIDCNLRCDLFVEKCIVLELKSVEDIKPIFKAQLITYMKLLEVPKGILINFNCTNLFEHGQKTFVNEYFRLLPDD